MKVFLLFRHLQGQLAAVARVEGLGQRNPPSANAAFYPS